MNVAVSIPPARTAAALERALELAVSAGADAAVFAEPPLGQWGSAPAGAVFAAALTSLPLGVALDAQGRHPLLVWERIAVLQRIVGPGTWFLISGWDTNVVRPPAALAPRPLPFTPTPWLVAADQVEAARARALGMPCLAPAGVVPAAGVWAGAGSLAAATGPGEEVTVLVTVPDSFEEDLRRVAEMKQARTARGDWIGLATEGFSSVAAGDDGAGVSGRRSP